MKSISHILIILILATTQTWAQEGASEHTLTVFDHSLEKTLLTKYQHQPFFLLQSLNPKENLNTEIWTSLVSDLDRFQKRHKEARLLYNIFSFTQKSLLKDYQKFAYFNQTLEEGIFDCVTGSAVFGLLLERYGIPYRIVETSAHVFVLGDIKGTPFVIESTLQEDGLIVGEEKVAAFLANFDVPDIAQLEIVQLEVGALEIESRQQVLGTIGLRELAGLQYYNEAVRHFLNNEFAKAYVQLIKAESLYPSERIVDFKEKMSLLVQISVQE